MALKNKIPCPRCEGKGVLPQYYYNKKGICFLCWGAKFIYVKVPEGMTPEEYYKKLREEQVDDLNSEKNKPKVELPDAKKHKNKDYFKGARSGIKVKPIDKPFNEEESRKKAREVFSEATEKELSLHILDFEDWVRATDISENERKDLETQLDELRKMLAEKVEARKKPAKKQDERIGTVIKGTRGKPDVTIVDVVAGTHIVGEFKNTKTGEIQYTVFPADKLEREDWEKFQSDLKANVGGAYSRFLRKQLFDSNPSEDLRRWLGDDGGDDARARRMKQRKARMEAEKIFYELANKDSKEWTVEAWTEVKRKVEAVDEYDDKADFLKTIDDYIARARVTDILAKYDAYNDTPEKLKKMLAEIQELPESNEKKLAISRAKMWIGEAEVKQVKNKYPSMYDASLDQLEEMLKEMKALPESEERDREIRYLEERIESKKKTAKADMLRKQALEDYKNNVLGKRQEIVNQGVTYKDTDLGKKVSELAGGKAIESKEDAIKVGATLREEMLKRLDATKPEGFNEVEKQIRELRKKPRQEVHTELKKLEDEYRNMWYDYQREQTEKRKQVVLEMMNEVREMGGVDVETIHLKGDSNKEMKKRVQEGSKYFPKEWVQISNTLPIRVVNERSRAYHQGEQAPSISIYGDVTQNHGILGLQNKEAETTIVHELGHRMEMTNSRLQKIIFNYLDDKTEGQGLANIYSWTKKEKYQPKKDGTEWVNNYIGKQYLRNGERRATEVLTMGLETLYFNTHKGSGYSTAEMEDREKYNAEHFDEEFFNLILGVLAGA